jgi:hypothetical protein
MSDFANRGPGQVDRPAVRLVNRRPVDGHLIGYRRIDKDIVPGALGGQIVPERGDPTAGDQFGGSVRRVLGRSRSGEMRGAVRRDLHARISGRLSAAALFGNWDMTES